MTAALNLRDGTVVEFDPVQGTDGRGAGVMVTLGGSPQGEYLTTFKIPADQVGAFVASLQLAHHQVRS